MIETRGYDEEEMGTHEYLYTFSVSIHSPTDYCITGVDSVYRGTVDTSYHGPEYNDQNGPDEWDELVTAEEYYELARERTYGANARIDEYTFEVVLKKIQMGEYCLANNSLGGAVDSFSMACYWLEGREYTDTPLYDLASYGWELTKNRVEREQGIQVTRPTPPR